MDEHVTELDNLTTETLSRPYGGSTLQAVLKMTLADAPAELQRRFVNVNARHGRGPARRLALGWTQVHSGHRFISQEMDDWARFQSARLNQEYTPIPWEPDIDPLLNLALDAPAGQLREFTLLTLQGSLLTQEEQAAAWAYVAPPTPPDEESANRARSLAALPLERLRTVLTADSPEGIAERLKTP